MDPKRLYETPFSDMAPTGPEAIFDIASVRRIIEVVRDVDQSASA
jgi:type I restriction enzyme R subunit